MIEEYGVVSFVLDMIGTHTGLLLNMFIIGFASLLATHCTPFLPT